jgi:hypothetical protein
MIRSSTFLLTAFCTSQIALRTSAQHTFEYANFPTAPLQMTVYVLVDAGGTGSPSNGADQTWEYSAITWAEVGTAWLGEATGTPYAGDYPSANNAWVLTPTGMSSEYQYSLLSSNMFEVMATHVPATPNVYSDRKQILQFPWALGQSFTDSYVATDGSGTATWTYDGYGTFITNVGTFTDQMKITSTEGDLVLWNESPIYPTLIVGSSNVMLFVPSTSGVAEMNSSAAVRLYPSPCDAVLTAEGLSAGNWHITDLAGRTVLSGSSNNAARQELNVAGLLAGCYLLVSDSDPHKPLRFVKG